MNDTSPGRLQHGQHRTYFVWSILFLTQLLVVIVLSLIYIPQLRRFEIEERRRETSDDDTYNISFDRTDSYMYSIMTPYFIVCCFLSIFLISMVTRIMMKCSDRLIHFSLHFNLCILTLYTCLALRLGVAQELLPIPVPFYGVVEVTCMVLLIFIIMFICRVWKRIPIAAQTIIATMTIVRDGTGTLSLHAYISFFLSWSYAVLIFKCCAALFMVRLYKSWDTDTDERFWLNCVELVLAFTSLYWTSKVLTNVV